MEKKSRNLEKSWRRPGSSAKKRMFRGNQHSDEVGSDCTSASAEKLKKSKDTSFDIAVEQNSDYCILNFFFVFSMLETLIKCSTCHGKLSFSKYGKRGVGFKVRLVCDCGERFIDSCSMIGSGYEINRRLVFVMRLLGVGMRGINLFCGLMELGEGLNIKVYYDIVQTIRTASKTVFDLVTLKAVQEEKELNGEKGCSEHLTVSGDGSWSKRGFSSLVGIVSLIGKFSKKVIDVEVLSTYCKACEWWKGKENAAEYKQWKEKHSDEKCNSNHEGSAGKMEVEGIVIMFIRSIEKFAVRYGFYIGDGDSKTFKSLLDVHPYGEEFEVKKLECVLHVAKRIFKRASVAKKNLTQKKKASKEAEKKTAKKIVAKQGKKVSAKKGKTPVEKKEKTVGLTVEVMKKLSVNYGLAVQRYKDSVEEMRREILAGFYHKISTDARPQHSYCPVGPDSWCKYRKAEATKTLHNFKHPPAFSEDVQQVLKPIYEDLTRDELLQRCLGGNTQNNNESYNNCVWRIAPKHTFNGKCIVEIASYIAACIFNEGYQPVLKIMSVMGIKIGKYADSFANARNIQRIILANKHSLQTSKEMRIKRKKAKTQEMELLEEEEGILYGAGIAD